MHLVFKFDNSRVKPLSELAQQIPSYSPALRRFKDRLATATITAGGAGVLFAILLIFFYLMYEVLPLFDNAKVTESSQYQWSQALPLYIAMEEQGEVGLRSAQTTDIFLILIVVLSGVAFHWAISQIV